VVFIFITVSLSLCYFNNLFLWRNDGEFDINVYITARQNLLHPCKIGRASYGVRLISYNAGWAPYDVVRCPAGHRPMLSYTGAGRYVTTQEKILKNRSVPRRLSNSPVMCKLLKSYDVSFICDHSVRHNNVIV